jgi:Fucose 4-O-acetylase and related acetyltransferases
MEKQRLFFIDIAKGIGITLVVCSHTEAHNLMIWAVGFFVPIFYFCSGYMTIYPSTNDSITQKMKIRAKKLLIPYLFFNLLLLLYYRRWAISGLYGIIYSRYFFFPLGSENNFELFIWGNFPMWFLTSLFVSYLLYYILLNNKNKSFIILIYLCMTYLLSQLPILLPWSIDTAFLSSLIMYAGLNAKKHNIISLRKYDILLCIFIYSLLLCVAGDMNLSIRQYGISFIIYYIMAILGCIVILWSAKRIERTWIGKVFALFGKHSLTIFCVEILFIRETSMAYCKLTNTDEVGILGGSCGIVVALFGGTLLSILLHKNRFLRKVLFG